MITENDFERGKGGVIYFFFRRRKKGERESMASDLGEEDRFCRGSRCERAGGGGKGKRGGR